MTENDFPALRSAAGASLIGRAIASLTASTGRAIATASAARLVRSQAATFQGAPRAETIKLGAMGLMTAALATWALAFAVPLYLSTAIPESAFLVLAVACGAAAAGAETLDDQWSRSRLRRVMAWLRAA